LRVSWNSLSWDGLSRFDRNLRELEGIFERYYFDARWRSRPASRARCNRMRRPR
jgi:hypothetical protein